MSQARHTSLSLRTQLTGLDGALRACDPTDYFATARLVQQLDALRTQMEKEQVPELLPACSMALRIAEVVNRDGQVGPKQAMSLIDGVLAQLCQALSVERAPAPAEAAAAEPTQPALPAGAEKTAVRQLKTISNRKLGEIMMQLSLLTPAQVEQALAHQRMTGCRLGEALIQMRVLSREAVESALRVQGVRRADRDDPWGHR